MLRSGLVSFCRVIDSLRLACIVVKVVGGDGVKSSRRDGWGEGGGAFDELRHAILTLTVFCFA